MLTSDQALQDYADMISDAIGCELEVNREFLDAYCSDDVRNLLMQLSDDRDRSEALVNALGDAREWGHFVASSSVIIPAGEVEVQFDGSPDEYFADPDEWTINGNLAYLGIDSVRVAVDMETLREEVAERLPEISARDREAFLHGYWEGVDFTATDIDNETPLDPDSRNELPTETVAELESEALDFLEAQWVWLHSSDLSRVGTDFHLSRNGHGAGFFDSPDARLRMLQDVAKAYGSCEVVSFGGEGLEVMR